MRVLFILLFILLMTWTVVGCTKKPTYVEGTCFEVNPFLTVSIDKVDVEYYYYTVRTFLVIHKRMKHEIFEKEMDEKGLIPKSCKELTEESGE